MEKYARDFGAAGELEEFNANIVGLIEIVENFTGGSMPVEIDPATSACNVDREVRLRQGNRSVWSRLRTGQLLNGHLSCQIFRLAVRSVTNADDKWSCEIIFANIDFINELPPFYRLTMAPESWQYSQA